MTVDLPRDITQDIGMAIEGLVWTGSIVGLLVAALIFYLLVRPPRHVRQRRKAERKGQLPREMDPAEADDLAQLVDRMEGRLEVLERALADHIERPAIGRRGDERILTPADHGRDSGRKE